ncbi:MAG TPA: MscL family protein [Terriglobales bacterium]
MDDTPNGLIGELRASVLKKRVGQIALAVVLAEAALRLVSNLTWYLIIPIIGKSLRGHTESVLFEAASSNPIRWDSIFGTLLEFVLVVIVVLFLNRWIQRKPSGPTEQDPEDDNRAESDALSAREESDIR